MEGAVSAVSAKRCDQSGAGRSAPDGAGQGGPQSQALRPGGPAVKAYLKALISLNPIKALTLRANTADFWAMITMIDGD
jgi:hypothetical protein